MLTSLVIVLTFAVVEQLELLLLYCGLFSLPCLLEPAIQTARQGARNTHVLQRCTHRTDRHVDHVAPYTVVLQCARGRDPARKTSATVDHPTRVTCSEYAAHTCTTDPTRPNMRGKAAWIIRLSTHPATICYR